MDSADGAQQGVKGCIGKYLAVELLMKTTRPDAMDVGFLVWQFGGDTCLIFPILSMAVVGDCGTGGSNSGSEGSFANTGAYDLPADLNVLGTLDDFPSSVATAAGGQTDIDPSALEGTVGLIVDSEQRCSPVFELVQVIVTRQLEEGEQANAVGCRQTSAHS